MKAKLAAMPDTPSPIRPTNDEARQITRDLIANARFGSLAVLHPDTGLPHVTRIAISTSRSGILLSLISDLSFHTKALRQNPDCSLLLGEPLANGDPLVYPRVSIQCKAAFLTRYNPEHADIRAHYLAKRPKAKLYIDFTDFHFVLFNIQSASLNGGFGKAYELTTRDCKL